MMAMKRKLKRNAIMIALVPAESKGSNIKAAYYCNLDNKPYLIPHMVHFIFRSEKDVSDQSYDSAGASDSYTELEDDSVEEISSDNDDSSNVSTDIKSREMPELVIVLVEVLLWQEKSGDGWALG